MSRRGPLPGQVVRYDYLWWRERATGQDGGAKDRPCAVAMARQLDPSGAPTVLLVPITHAAPFDSDSALELPQAVCAHLGLDDARHWIVLSEANLVQWDDPGFVPLRKGRWDYGFLPPKLAAEIARAISERFKAHRLRTVARDNAFKPRPA